MTEQNLKSLLKKYNSGSCNDEERAIIEAWYMQMGVDEYEPSDEDLVSITAMNPPISPISIRRPLWKWMSVAAAILIASSIGLYFFIEKGNVLNKNLIAKAPKDIAPGGNRAVLTLSNGKKIILSDAAQGIITDQHDALITKASDDQIVYEAENNKDIPATISYNTMSTPRGGQYQLKLSDGSQVWLNAFSSITFPTHFSGKERNVEITGEAYFEVAHDPVHPFVVNTKGQRVQVLGTHFNIKAYNDDNEVSTTLLEGSVKVFASGKSNVLAPGEQLINSPAEFKVIRADAEEAISWHNGDFVFKKQLLEQIMKTVSRWYDIDISYENYTASKKTFSGVISRKRDLSAIINMLEKGTTLKFNINGKKVTITN